MAELKVQPRYFIRNDIYLSQYDTTVYIPYYFNSLSEIKKFLKNYLFSSPASNNSCRLEERYLTYLNNHLTTNSRRVDNLLDNITASVYSLTITQTGNSTFYFNNLNAVKKFLQKFFADSGYTYTIRKITAYFDSNNYYAIARKTEIINDSDL